MHRRRASTLFNPFGIYLDIWSNGLKTVQMLTSSAEVIHHRSKLIEQVMDGGLPVTDSEFVLMWQEKMMAAFEAYLAMAKHMGNAQINRSVNRNSSQLPLELFLQQMDMAMACMQPYARKAKANAKRLRKNVSDNKSRNMN